MTEFNILCDRKFFFHGLYFSTLLYSGALIRVCRGSRGRSDRVKYACTQDNDTSQCYPQSHSDQHSPYSTEEPDSPPRAFRGCQQPAPTYALNAHLVDVELTGVHSSGQTVADVYGYLKVDDTWGKTGKNCEVATDLDVCIIHIFRFWRTDEPASQITAFFELFLDCVARCDEVSPLNLRPAS